MPDEYFLSMYLYLFSPLQSESVCTSHHLNYPLDEAESPPVISLGPLASCARLEVRRTNLYIINLETQHRRETVTEEVLSSHSLPCSSGELERQEILSTALQTPTISGVSQTVTALILVTAGFCVFAAFTLIWINMFKSKYYTSLINKTQTTVSDYTNKV